MDGDNVHVDEYDDNQEGESSHNGDEEPERYQYNMRCGAPGVGMWMRIIRHPIRQLSKV